jgi:hypothetical protein
MNSEKNNLLNKEILKLNKKKYIFRLGYTNWISEVSGLGKTFRYFLKYPSFLPLFFGSDHGVNIGSRYYDFEKNNYNIFFSWNKRKIEFLKKIKHLKSYYIAHPFIFYRRNKLQYLFFKKKRGTIIFFPHSNDNIVVKFNIAEFVDEIKRLKPQFKPISVCLMQYDVNKKNLRYLRSNNINIVTAGHVENYDFVDNFYKMISNFKYAASPKVPFVGSNLFYCVEASIPFFFLRSEAKFYFKDTNELRDVSLYGDKYDIINYYKFVKVFEGFSERVTKKQKDLVNYYLGLNSNISRFKLIFIVYLSFLKNLDIFLLNILFFIKKKLKFLN